MQEFGKRKTKNDKRKKRKQRVYKRGGFHRSDKIKEGENNE